MKRWSPITWGMVSLLVGLSLTRAQAGYAQPVSPVRLAPRVMVHDQALVADQVTVAEVVALQDGLGGHPSQSSGELRPRDWGGGGPYGRHPESDRDNPAGLGHADPLPVIASRRRAARGL